MIYVLMVLAAVLIFLLIAFVIADMMKHGDRFKMLDKLGNSEPKKK